ncbi:putative 2-aminoethylphosphonate ABC transporter substrate-binding protein [Fusobacterium sp. IOR10]|uniref:putative 2-aminoethylphosphonate ABC transporter substrate-binding protein n=1 Tax=Fusobacterium sp. IOR10 TaxID=2665157 RepID=UPI0013D0701B|nr:putative 2-aminoethylphosphonate ABC transporter substrate-binding protein [Fusobacterium sp. IOR10]
MKIKKLFSALALIGVIVGCGDKSIKTPKKEINIYTALETEQIPEYLKGFKEKYPNIKLNVIRDSTGIIISKLLAEKDNPQADVIWGTAATGILSLNKVNLLKEYSPKGIEHINKKFVDQSGTKPKWVGNNAWMNAIVVNKIELKKLGLKEPKSFKDLLNPNYKGLISMPNPNSSGTGFLTVSALIQLMGENKAWEYMKDLHKNIGVYTHSGSKPSKMAAKGESPIGISYDYPGIKLMNQGAPVNVYFPTEGCGWDSEANALINKKIIKKESKLFLDWAISENTMKEYSKSYAIVSRDINVSVPKGFPKNPINKLIENDFNWAATNRDSILHKWENNFGSKTETK